MSSEIGSGRLVAGTLQRRLHAVMPLRKIAVSHVAIAVGLAFTVAACSSIDSMFAGDPPPPTARTSGGAAPAQSGDYPKLNTVPERPARPTPPPQQGLAADRQGARYADNEVRPVNETADAVVGQRLGASTPRPAAPQNAAQPGAAQPAAAPVAPVQSAPPTPMQQQVPPQSAAPAAPVAQAPATQQQLPMAQAPMPQQQAAMPAPAPVPMASTLPPPPAPSQQALVLPPTTRPAVSTVSGGRAPAAAPMPSPAVYGNVVQVAVVQFGRASSGLSGDDVAVLRDVAEIQKKQGGVVRIIGHASQDSTSDDPQRAFDANYNVSLARANAIASQLASYGVPRNAIQVQGAGDRQPEYDPVTAVAVASNRRAEIFLAF
jgi:outer membrane protein OmpA-like peptidoglycan-associated protein